MCTYGCENAQIRQFPKILIWHLVKINLHGRYAVYTYTKRFTLTPKDLHLHGKIYIDKETFTFTKEKLHRRMYGYTGKLTAISVSVS